MNWTTGGGKENEKPSGRLPDPESTLNLAAWGAHDNDLTSGQDPAQRLGRIALPARENEQAAHVDGVHETVQLTARWAEQAATRRQIPPAVTAAANSHDDYDDYSATMLSSHWTDQSGRDAETFTGMAMDFTDMTPTPWSEPLPMLIPDAGAGRMEDQVLRFGPGFRHEQASTGVRSRSVPQVWTGAKRSRSRRRIRQVGLVIFGVLVAIAFYLRHHPGPTLVVQSVNVRTDDRKLSCGSTADVIAIVKTNGAPGRITYRWLRSDGTASAVLHENIVTDQRVARLHLRWRFEGEGHFAARATLDIKLPKKYTDSARFTYKCDRSTRSGVS